MKFIYLTLCLLIYASGSSAQNIRWEVSGRAFASFNSFLLEGRSASPQFQQAGVRVGAAPNMTLDFQLGLWYQTRTDFGQSAILTSGVRSPRGLQACEQRRLTHESSGLEIETLVRLRNSQFSRVHAFMGLGVAYLLSPSLHSYDQDIRTATFTTPNGNTRTIECGFPEGLFKGAEFGLIFAPGVRFRMVHKVHLELESQLRYYPQYNGETTGGLGLGVVYNFY